jgi:hypothetical protein
MRPIAEAIAVAVAAGVVGAAAAQTTIELRGGVAPITADRVVLEQAGVRVLRGSETAVFLAWDDVRDVRGSGIRDADRALLAMAEDVWRARSRLVRGDAVLARPLFEKHFPAFKGSTSETALIVAEGTLRARLATADAGEVDGAGGTSWVRAIVPAIDAARLRAAGVATTRFVALRPVFDDATRLVPELAPSWDVDATTRSVAAELDAIIGGPGGTSIAPEVRRIAELYAALLRGEPAPPSPRRDDPGAALLAAIAGVRAAADADPEARRKAHAAALTAAKDLGDWATAWVNEAIGRSLVARTDAGDRTEGVLALLRVAAPGAGAPPRLARTSLDLAARTLRELGDTASAAVLESELIRLGGRAAPSAGRAERPRAQQSSASTTSDGSASAPSGS